MLTTVRARILAFALLSVAAVAGLTFIAWMIIAKAEHTSQALVGESLEQSWMLVDLGRNRSFVHRVGALNSPALAEDSAESRVRHLVTGQSRAI